MSKPRKIKRKKNPFGQPKRPIKTILIIVGIAALIFLGISLYSPITNYLSGKIAPDPDISSSIPESSAPAPSVVPEVSKEPEVVAETKDMHGAILSYETAVNPAELDTFISSLPKDINTVVIELKNLNGEVLFNSTNEKANAWGAVSENPINLKDLNKKLEENNLSLAVILSTFSDPIAARANQANAIMHSSGVIWIDNSLDKGGKPWSTPYSDGVREYNKALAKEVADAGATHVILDYLRFPNDPTNSAIVGTTEQLQTTPKAAMLQQFIAETQSVVGDTKVSVLLSDDVLIDIEGSQNQLRYGGSPLNLSENIVLLQANIVLGASYSPEVQSRLDSENTILMQSDAVNSIPTGKSNFIINFSK